MTEVLILCTKANLKQTVLLTRKTMGEAQLISIMTSGNGETGNASILAKYLFKITVNVL